MDDWGYPHDELETSIFKSAVHKRSILEVITSFFKSSLELGGYHLDMWQGIDSRHWMAREPSGDAAHGLDHRIDVSIVCFSMFLVLSSHPHDEFRGFHPTISRNADHFSAARQLDQRESEELSRYLQTSSLPVSSHAQALGRVEAKDSNH